jgi:hypothetical protein
MNKKTPRINELINEPDNIEIIRDQIAAILSLELQNQSTLAREAELPDYKDFNIPVYVENDRPYEASGNAPVTRLINVLLPKLIVPKINARSGDQKETATIHIDCVACGNDFGGFRDDRSAAIRAWKICRLARRILMSDAYMYLGMRGVIGSRAVVSMESGSPPDRQDDGSAAFAFFIVRIALEVTFVERSIAAQNEILEGIDFEIDPATGLLTAAMPREQINGG